MTRADMKSLLGSLALFLWAMAASETFAAPTNTVEVGDPTIAREGDWYYVFSSGTGAAIRRSKDLVNWELLPPVFPGAVPDWVREKIPTVAPIVWAPDILKFQNNYYCYYSYSTGVGSQRSVIGLATAESLDPDKPGAAWKDQGLVVESTPDKDPYNAIDPAMVLDEAGKPWLVWGSSWAGIYLAEIDPATGKLLEGGKKHRLAANPSVNIEGAIVRFHDGFYYLFVSHNDFKNYNVKVGRSKLITGPYMDRLGKPMTEGNGTPLIAAYGDVVGPGHCGVLLGECPWYDLLVHHVLMEGAYDTRATRDLQVRPIFWATDGWPLAGEVILETPPAAPQPLEGWWSHRVGFGDVHRILFRGDGTLSSRSGARGTWKLDGKTLTMNWPRPEGGDAVDVCVLHPDGNSYVGRNAADTDIRGTREPVTSDRTP